MARYHISDDGDPRPCGAQLGNCPYGADVHGEFDSVSDARKFAEDYLEKNIGNFTRGSKKAGLEAREASRKDEANSDDFRGLTEEEIKDALLNTGQPAKFNPDGTLADKPSGTLHDPIDLAELSPEDAERYLLAEGYSPEKIESFKNEFGELSQKALITAATAEIMIGPPQRHVRFSEDPQDNYSFSMANFEEVGTALGMLTTNPQNGFLEPVKDPKAVLSWMQVSNPANNVFMIQDHTGINRLYMPQTANKNVTGEAGRKLDLLAKVMENNPESSISDLARNNPEFRQLQTDLLVSNRDLEKMRTGDYGTNRNGEVLDRGGFLSSVEVNGRNWMVRDLRQTAGINSELISVGAEGLQKMKPTQSGISVLQVQGMTNATIASFGDKVVAEKASLDSMSKEQRAARLQTLLDDSMGKPTIVTRDNYILDGHHGLAKAALLNTSLRNGTVARRLARLGINYDLPSEANLPVVSIDMEGGQGFDALTYWTKKNGFPISGMR